jgi:hypothetical protein
MVVHACDPSYVGGTGRSIRLRLALGKSVTPYLKIKTKVKRTGGLAQVVE